MCDVDMTDPRQAMAWKGWRSGSGVEVVLGDPVVKT